MAVMINDDLTWTHKDQFGRKNTAFLDIRRLSKIIGITDPHRVYPRDLVSARPTRAYCLQIRGQR